MKLALVYINRGIFCDKIAPLGLCSIASYLKQYMQSSNIKIRIVDQNTENIYDSIKNVDPDIIGVSSVTQNFEDAKNFMSFAKQQLGVPLIFGGVHITTLPLSLPKYVDVGVIGEGEETMLELMNIFKETTDFQESDLQNVKGICYYNNGKLKINEKRPLIEPLDKIPIPDRSLLNMEHYLERTSIVPFRFKRNVHILTSRGCPYKCAFCSTSVFWGKHRAFSADRVINEIKSLINDYHVELIHIFDDLFIINQKRFFEIADKIDKEKINQKVMFMCLARSDLLNDKIMEAFKKMNVDCIGIGLESGSEKVLKYLKRGTTTVNQNEKAIQYCLDYKITCMGSFMIGNPNETREDLEQTLALIKKNQYNPYFSAITYITTPLPGTTLWEDAKEKGVVSEEMNWNDLCMDIPNNIEDIKKAPLLIDVNIKDFYDMSQLFREENEKQQFKNYPIILSPELLKKAMSNPKKAVKFGLEILKTKWGIYKNFKQRGEMMR